jgi:antitoxin YefM
LKLKMQKVEKIMITINCSDFSSNPEKYLERVENGNEVLFLKRETGKGFVLISSDEYNSIMETLHLLKSRKTTDRILESLAQIESGDVVTIPTP